MSVLSKMSNLFKIVTIFYANVNNGFGVYIVSFGDLGVDEMVYIADSLEEFFVNEVGADVFNTVW